MSLRVPDAPGTRSQAIYGGLPSSDPGKLAFDPAEFP
jgi:hypothetical protein